MQPFDSVVTVPFTFGTDWRGRVFLFNPSWAGEKQEELRFLLDIVRQVGPAIYNVYLLHRLRRRAYAAERARVARELHDGAVQSLIAVEMQVDVLRRQAEANRPIDGELERIQGLLREEVLKLRELMQQMKAIDVDSQKLLPVLRDAVETVSTRDRDQCAFRHRHPATRYASTSVPGVSQDCAGRAR